MNKMNRITAAIAALFLLSAAPVFTRGVHGAQQAPAARASVAGEWTIYLELQQEAMFRGSIVQDGGKLTGVMGNETAEYPVAGTVEGTEMKLVWSIYEQGEKVQISVTAKFEREGLTGTAKIGQLEGIEVFGQRTSKA